jgi:hypothetical protein
MFAQAIDKGTEFLLQQQALSGAWMDFLAKRGVSDSWVTAYVGECILQVFPRSVASKRDMALNRACEWLRGVMRPDGGWGYNDNCPADSDSTAHSVLFLHGCGWSVPDVCYKRLLEFQKEDGGFATYERHNVKHSWGISHADVSPVVLRSLRTRLPPNHSAIQRGYEYVLSQLRQNGLWQSFWWLTPLYSTLVNVRLLEEAGISYDKARVWQAVLEYGALAEMPLPGDAFQTALMGEILAILVPGSPQGIQIGCALVEFQLSDGSWDTSAMLRITNRRQVEPWMDRGCGGIVTSDQRRIFTTATVLRCLGTISYSP